MINPGYVLLTCTQYCQNETCGGSLILSRKKMFASIKPKVSVGLFMHGLHRYNSLLNKILTRKGRVFLHFVSKQIYLTMSKVIACWARGALSHFPVFC